jgi:hypothetical protein
MDKPLPSYITFSPDVLFQALKDEAVLLDMASEQYFSLNELGARMWQLLSENGDTGAVLEQLLLEYEVERAALRRDMAHWIDELVELGLASVDDGAAPQD